MKVLHTISGLQGGGAEHMVLQVCDCAMRERAVDMEVVALSGHRQIEWKFEKAGVRVNKNEGVEMSRFRSFAAGVRLIMQKRPAVIHSHMFHACIVGCIVKMLRPQVKHIFTLHNTFQPGYLKRMLLYATRRLRDVDTIFPATKRRWYQKKKVVQLSNGVDFSRYAVERSSAFPVFTFLFAGRLEKQKNPLFLVDFCRSMPHTDNFQILVAGDGALLRRLQKAVDQEKMSDRIKLLGFRNDLPFLLGNAHCVLVPSFWEGMPLIMLEAAAAAVPVLATPEANASNILDEATGYISRLEHFAETAAHIMQNPGEANRKAQSLRTIAYQRYHITRVCRQHLDLYKKVLNR